MRYFKRRPKKKVKPSIERMRNLRKRRRADFHAITVELPRPLAERLREYAKLHDQTLSIATTELLSGALRPAV